MRHPVRFLAILALIIGGFWLRPAYADDSTQQVISLVNAERARRGLAPLSLSPELAASAQTYAQAMAKGGFFGHEGPDGSTPASRNEAAGYQGWSFLAENIAAGQASPAEALQAWMNSPTHRENILAANARETGVGLAVVAGSPYRVYWVQEFGARPAAPVARFQPTSRSDRQADLGWVAPTGHRVFGEWLSFLRHHGDVSTLGLPRSGVIADPTAGGQTVQYFQRAILELHPENPPAMRIQRRLLGDILYPGADAPVDPAAAPPGPSSYFPVTPGQATGLGHFVANYTRSGQAIYFKDYFDSHGGVEMFGYPKEEPKQRNGLWTQRFQAATFEYHPENDRDGNAPGSSLPLRTFRVQLELLGDKFIEAKGLPYR